MALSRIAHSAPTSLRQRAGQDTSLPVAAVQGDKRMDEDEVKRLKNAGQAIAKYVAARAAQFSSRIPASVGVDGDEDGVYVKAGGEVAPNAYPFDPPDNPPVYHPLFARIGTKRYRHKWYAQPYRPFMEEGAEMGADQAANAFAEVINDWAKSRGFDK